MGGNVEEWTASWYDQEQKDRVLRGGSWALEAEYVCVAYRRRNEPGLRHYDIGFRCAQ
jgi:formylglycine-generating enzyme required for sulfatase activity